MRERRQWTVSASCIGPNRVIRLGWRGGDCHVMTGNRNCGVVSAPATLWLGSVRSEGGCHFLCPARLHRHGYGVIQKMWLKVVAFLLLLPMYWWCDLPPFWSSVDLAAHFIEYEGEHCNEICPHPVSLIDTPQSSAVSERLLFDLLPLDRLITILPPDHHARDHPPPLFSSISHSLRAPPTLILA